MQAHYRRNFVALLGDYVGFGLALTFANSTTTLPDFIGRLSKSELFVGLFSAAGSGAWLLPQLAYGRLLTNKPRKKPFVMLGAAIGRPSYLVYAALLWFGLERNPALALALLFAVQVMFLSSDALAAVAWFDMFAKAIPGHRRGRLVGTAQALRGTLAIAAGALIAALLSETGPPFPRNYAILFALAGGGLLFSLVSLSFVVEPDEPVQEEQPLWRDYLPHLVQMLRNDRAFRYLIVSRMLAGFDALALNFYIRFATTGLALPSQTVGVFNVVQTVGSILASLGLGLVSERVGNHRVIQIATALSLTAPLLGLTLFLVPVPNTTLATVIYAWVFLVIGVSLSANVLGFFNYALDLAPPGHRPSYIGLFSTISGVFGLALPPLGGLLLGTTSYGMLFCLTAAVLAAAHLSTHRLRPVGRTDVQAAGPEP